VRGVSVTNRVPRKRSSRTDLGSSPADFIRSATSRTAGT
jgi:hypothetical protein